MIFNFHNSYYFINLFIYRQIEEELIEHHVNGHINFFLGAAYS